MSSTLTVLVRKSGQIPAEAPIFLNNFRKSKHV